MNVLVTGCQSIAKYPNLFSSRLQKNPVAATNAICEYEAQKSEVIDNHLMFLHDYGGFPVDVLISPSGDGLDQVIEGWASEMKIPIKRFKPKWSSGDRRAGFDAMRAMLQAADAAILFGKNGDKATLRLKLEMERRGKPVYYKEIVTTHSSEQTDHSSGPLF